MAEQKSKKLQSRINAITQFKQKHYKNTTIPDVIDKFLDNYFNGRFVNICNNVNLALSLQNHVKNGYIAQADELLKLQFPYILYELELYSIKDNGKDFCVFKVQPPFIQNSHEFSILTDRIKNPEPYKKVLRSFLEQEFGANYQTKISPIQQNNYQDFVKRPKLIYPFNFSDAQLNKMRNCKKTSLEKTPKIFHDGRYSVILSKSEGYLDGQRVEFLTKIDIKDALNTQGLQNLNVNTSIATYAVIQGRKDGLLLLDRYDINATKNHINKMDGNALHCLPFGEKNGLKIADKLLYKNLQPMHHHSQTEKYMLCFPRCLSACDIDHQTNIKVYEKNSNRIERPIADITYDFMKSLNMDNSNLMKRAVELIFNSNSSTDIYEVGSNGKQYSFNGKHYSSNDKHYSKYREKQNRKMQENVEENIENKIEEEVK